MSETTTYRGTVRCKRCQTARYVSPLAVGFTHWFCQRSESGAWCMTFNDVNFNNLMPYKVTHASSDKTP